MPAKCACRPVVCLLRRRRSTFYSAEDTFELPSELVGCHRRRESLSFCSIRIRKADSRLAHLAQEGSGRKYGWRCPKRSRCRARWPEPGMHCYGPANPAAAAWFHRCWPVPVAAQVTPREDLANSREPCDRADCLLLGRSAQYRRFLITKGQDRGCPKVQGSAACLRVRERENEAS